MWDQHIARARGVLPFPKATSGGWLPRFLIMLATARIDSRQWPLGHGMVVKTSAVEGSAYVHTPTPLFNSSCFRTELPWTLTTSVKHSVCRIAWGLAVFFFNLQHMAPASNEDRTHPADWYSGSGQQAIGDIIPVDHWRVHEHGLSQPGSPFSETLQERHLSAQISNFA